MTIHVLAYAPRLARLAWRVTAGDRQRGTADGQRHATAGGRGRGVAARNDTGAATVDGAAARWLLLAAALAAGLILAALTLQLTGRWQVSAVAAVVLPVS